MSRDPGGCDAARLHPLGSDQPTAAIREMLQTWAQLAQEFAQHSRRWFGNCLSASCMQGLFQSVKLFASVCVTPHANVSRFVGDVTGISDPLRLMFDSLDLAFAAIADGRGDESTCCQEEAHDEPWDATQAQGALWWLTSSCLSSRCRCHPLL